jgi:hypothetical protein
VVVLSVVPVLDEIEPEAVVKVSVVVVELSVEVVGVTVVVPCSSITTVYKKCRVNWLS